MARSAKRSTYGAGTVQHLGGDRYRLFFSVGTNPITGKPVRKSPTIRASSVAAAHKELARLVSAEHGRADGVTFAGVIAEYLELAVGDPDDPTSGMSPTTRAENEGAVARYLTDHLKGMKLRDLTARHLDKLYIHLLREGGVCRRRGLDADGHPKKCATKPCQHGGGDPLAPSTVDRLHTVIEAALEQAVRWDYIVSNPARKTRPIDVIAEEAQMPPAEDLLKLLVALDELPLDGYGIEGGSPLPDFVALTLAMGPRPQEPCALRWGAIDLDRNYTRPNGESARYGMVAVVDAVKRGRGGATVGPTKTKKKRYVTVSEPVVQVLEARRARWREAPLAAGVPLDDMFVFPSKERVLRPWRPDSMGRELRKVRDELGLSKQITFRNLRHYCVSVLAAQNVDVVTTAKRMGHSPQMMLNVYAHLFEAPDLAAAEILGRQASER